MFASPPATITQPDGFLILLIGSVCLMLSPVVTGSISTCTDVIRCLFLSLPMSVVSSTSTGTSSSFTLNFFAVSFTTSLVSSVRSTLSDEVDHLYALGTASST